MKVITPHGETIDLGTTETGPTVGIIDYSVRKTDDFGVTTVVERGFARRMSVRFALPTATADALQLRLAGLRATPARWIADGRFASLAFEGFFKDFEIEVPFGTQSYCRLTVEGLTATSGAVDAGGDPAPVGSISTFRLIDPVAIEGAALVSSTVPENDAPEWSASTTYAAGARVTKAATHRIYESAAAGNVGNDPAGTSGKWVEVGPTNRWAMFDQALGTTTTVQHVFGLVLDPGPVDAVALLDTNADGALCRVVSGSTVLFEQSLPGTGGTRPILFTGLPRAAGARIEMTIARNQSSQFVSVGTLLVGSMRALGVTEASPTAGITDYSRKTVDDFGEVTIVERAWSKRMAAKALIRTDAVDVVADRIAAVRARPVLWIGDEALGSLTIYGFFKDFSIEVAETTAKLSLSIEGLSTAAKVAPLTASVDWESILDPKGTKPKDGATVGAVVGENLRDPDGLLVFPQDIINQPISVAADGRLLQAVYGGGEVELGRVATSAALALVAEAIGKLADRSDTMFAAEDVTRRFLDQSVTRLQEAAALAALEGDRTRRIFRDAGIRVDAGTGEVRIYGVDETANALSEAVIRLSAVEGRINLRVTRTELDDAIARAVIDPSQVAELGELQVRLSSAELDLDALGAAIALKADNVLLGELGGRVTTVEADLDAVTGEVALKASSATVDGIADRVTTAEATLTALGDVASFTQQVVATRSAADAAAAAGEDGLRALLAGDAVQRRQVTQLALARQEITARLIDGDAAEAIARQFLGVRVDEAEAVATTDRIASVSRDQALAGEVTQFRTDYDGAVGELGRRIGVVSDANGATASTLEVLRADYDGSYAVFDERTIALADAAGALSGRVTTLKGTVDGHTGTITTHSSSINGLNLRNGVELNSDGYITGFVQNNDGRRGDFLILADRFAIGSPGNPSSVPFEVVDGVTYMKSAVIRNATIGTLKLLDGSVTKRAAVQMTTPRTGTGSAVVALSLTIVLPFPADVNVDGKGSQNYSGSFAGFAATLVVNGQQVDGASGGTGSATTAFPLSGLRSLPAGTHVVELQWLGLSSDITLTSALLRVDATYK